MGKHGKGRTGIGTYYSGEPALEENPYRTRLPLKIHVYILDEVTLEKISLFADAENLLDFR
ncbi:hypothetical protein ACSMXM_03760 [Pacificimonas sp. ICDLI1SI03]